MAIVETRTKFKIWSDVVFAIFLRNIRSSFNDKFGLSWSVFQPVLFIFVLSYGRGMLMGDVIHTIPIFIFMLYGMVLIQLFITTFQNVAKSIKRNKSLFAFRQVQPISAALAAGLFELLVKLFIVCFLVLIVYLLKEDKQLADPLNVLVIFFQLWLLAISLGLIAAILSCYVPEVEKLVDLAIRPLFFISGAFFSLKDIPEQFWVYLTWNPILHAIELSRDSAYPSFAAEGVSHMYLTLFTLFSVFLALALYRITWKSLLSR
ncbi:ABC transporter permease [Thalassotalea agarivorans]|uniref:Transport permease protein n=1 Tax=Thalassotalea agarivorans TaxID=349064 RepID=A0A1H9YIC9_THASX|nr:ABC transporter permease [Thalassotalea agarivorans]SES68787.1 capsular polysaccharide transport system permease protein [Thalassotalea agarivorans]